MVEIQTSHPSQSIFPALLPKPYTRDLLRLSFLTSNFNSYYNNNNKYKHKKNFMALVHK
jgi:hypothetical protein